jgi:carboxylesterase type B
LSAESEDCLQLNVYAPASFAKDAQAVLVWIHGGYLRSGFSGRAQFDGSRFVTDHGIVVVTLNYRLNG